MGVSESDFINDDLQTKSFQPSPGLIQVPLGNSFFPYLMNQKLTVLKSANDLDDMRVEHVLDELGNELPLTVPDGRCGWYAVLIGLSLLNTILNDKLYDEFKVKKIELDSSNKLYYNKHFTCAFQKKIISNIPTGGKGRKYKIYTGSRGGKYYKRKGKKIYI